MEKQCSPTSWRQQMVRTKRSDAFWKRSIEFLNHCYPTVEASVKKFLADNPEWDGDMDPPTPYFRVAITLRLWLKSEAKPRRGELFRPTRCRFISEEEKDQIAAFLATTLSSIDNLSARLRFSDEEGVLEYRLVPTDYSVFGK